MTPISAPNQAAYAYDVLAPYYDDFTAGYAYESWMEGIEARALALGLSRNRALDLACGTGKSTAQLIARGYSVLACDISPGMIAATFSCAARVLAPSGIFAFDVNSLRTYRTTFSLDTVREGDGVLLAWKGESEPTFARGEVGAATVEIFVSRQDGLWERRSMRHVQRHHPPDAIRPGVGLSRLRVHRCRTAPRRTTRGWVRRRAAYQACVLRSARDCVPPRREVICVSTVGP